MDLHALIIHLVQKDQYSNDTDLLLRQDELPCDNLAENFVESVRDTYNRKSALHWGSFEDNEDSFPFQGMMRDYLEDGESFASFTRRATRHLENEMAKEHMATGGYVVFAHFSDEDGEYVLNLMVDDTQGFGVDKDLSLLERIHLDVEDLQIAGRVNIDSWREDEDGYVSFIPGTKAVSQYFKRFVGVRESASPKKATLRVKTAIRDYMEAHDYHEDDQVEINNRVADYLKRCLNSGDAATVSMLSNIVDGENPARFSEHAMSDDYRVDATFSPNRSVINSIQRYEVKSDEIDIRFNKSLFRERVNYDPETQDLTVHEVTQDMLSEDLRREMGLDN